MIELNLYLFSALNMGRLYSLDAILDEQSGYFDNHQLGLDMKSHRTMGEILSILRAKLTPMAMIAFLQEYAFVNIKQSINCFIFVFFHTFSSTNFQRVPRIAANIRSLVARSVKLSEMNHQHLRHIAKANELKRNGEPADSIRMASIENEILQTANELRNATPLLLGELVIESQRLGRLAQRMVRHQRMLKTIYHTDLELSPRALRSFHIAATDLYAMRDPLYVKIHVARAQLHHYVAELAPLIAKNVPVE